MKLTYWVANCLEDSQAYNIRKPTRKAVLEEINCGDYAPGMYTKPHKVTVEYNNALDLLNQCLCESGPDWEGME